MYEKPTLERFGTFRELTLLGPSLSAGDGGGMFITSCNPPSDRSEFLCPADRGS